LRHAFDLTGRHGTTTGSGGHVSVRITDADVSGQRYQIQMHASGRYNPPLDRGRDLAGIRRVARELDHVFAAGFLNLNQAGVDLHFDCVTTCGIDHQIPHGSSHNESRSIGNRALGKEGVLKREDEEAGGQKPEGRRPK